MSKSSKVEKQFNYRGYNCVCLGLSMGHRCGYVKLETPKSYNDLDVIDCHGGLTFSDYFKGEKTIESGIEEGFYIGFDCAHWGDGRDNGLITELNEPQMISALMMMNGIYDSDDIVRTLEFVEQECKMIVDQLIENGIK